jgi:L-ascorbate metabolism protein UlaG (beta-lactamase superfamily)
MKIQWLGHSSFLITTANGTKILTDPYDAVFGLAYGKIDAAADIVTVSHEHGDHNNTAAVKGNPQVIRTPEAVTAAGISVRGIDTFHDNSQGSERGKNTVFCFAADGMHVCHLGDLGHMLTDKQIQGIGKTDILMIPVGGNFTIDAAAADKVIAALQPAVVIPMHFCNDRCPEFPVAGISEFTKGKSNTTIMAASEVEYSKESLPDSPQIIILSPAR